MASSVTYVFALVCSYACTPVCSVYARNVHNFTNNFDETLAAAAHGILEVEIFYRYVQVLCFVFVQADVDVPKPATLSSLTDLDMFMENPSEFIIIN